MPAHSRCLPSLCGCLLAALPERTVGQGCLLAKSFGEKNEIGTWVQPCPSPEGHTKALGIVEALEDGTLGSGV